jgi:hypothetical protein
VVGHDQAENGVAEKFEALVRPLVVVLGAPGTVRQGAVQKARVAKRPADAFGQRVEVAARSVVLRRQFVPSLAIT